MTNTIENAIHPLTYNFVGTRLQAIAIDDLVRLIDRVILRCERRVIFHHNLHSVYLYHHDARMRKFHAVADYTHVDGMALVLLARLCGVPLMRRHRTTYLDLLPHLATAAITHKWRLFYLGSRPGVGERAAEVLRGQYGGLEICTRHGYFDMSNASVENEELLRDINEFRPDVLLVGMGMPRQEAWIAANVERLSVRAILCSGAMMDYVAGEIPSPPRWLGQVGMEWLYRLATEPRRLWYRYIVEPWFVLRLVGSQLLGREFPMVERHQPKKEQWIPRP